MNARKREKQKYKENRAESTLPESGGIVLRALWIAPLPSHYGDRRRGCVEDGDQSLGCVILRVWPGVELG